MTKLRFALYTIYLLVISLALAVSAAALSQPVTYTIGNDGYMLGLDSSGNVLHFKWNWTTGQQYWESTSYGTVSQQIAVGTASYIWKLDGTADANGNFTASCWNTSTSAWAASTMNFWNIAVGRNGEVFAVTKAGAIYQGSGSCPTVSFSLIAGTLKTIYVANFCEGGNGNATNVWGLDANGATWHYVFTGTTGCTSFGWRDEQGSGATIAVAPSTSTTIGNVYVTNSLDNVYQWVSTGTFTQINKVGGVSATVLYPADGTWTCALGTCSSFTDLGIQLPYVNDAGLSSGDNLGVPDQFSGNLEKVERLKNASEVTLSHSFVTGTQNIELMMSGCSVTGVCTSGSMDASLLLDGTAENFTADNTGVSITPVSPIVVSNLNLAPGEYFQVQINPTTGSHTIGIEATGAAGHELWVGQVLLYPTPNKLGTNCWAQNGTGFVNVSQVSADIYAAVTNCHTIANGYAYIVTLNTGDPMVCNANGGETCSVVQALHN